jgi:hypothetical protein
MSALGRKPTFRSAITMSAFARKADLRGLLFPARSSQSCYLEVKRWLPIPGRGTVCNLLRIVSNHRSQQMMTFPATSREEDLLIREVPDEALEAAGGNDVAANYTLADCTGLSVCPA